MIGISALQLDYITYTKTQEVLGCSYYDHYGNVLYTSSYQNVCEDLTIVEQTDNTLTFHIEEEKSLTIEDEVVYNDIEYQSFTSHKMKIASVRVLYDEQKIVEADYQSTELTTFSTSGTLIEKTIRYTDKRLNLALFEEEGYYYYDYGFLNEDITEQETPVLEYYAFSDEELERARYSVEITEENDIKTYQIMKEVFLPDEVTEDTTIESVLRKERIKIVDDDHDLSTFKVVRDGPIMLYEYFITIEDDLVTVYRETSEDNNTRRYQTEYKTTKYGLLESYDLYDNDFTYQYGRFDFKRVRLTDVGSSFNRPYFIHETIYSSNLLDRNPQYSPIEETSYGIKVSKIENKTEGYLHQLFNKQEPTQEQYVNYIYGSNNVVDSFIYAFEGETYRNDNDHFLVIPYYFLFE
jgi:hypothetical protein